VGDSVYCVDLVALFDHVWDRVAEAVVFVDGSRTHLDAVVATARGQSSQPQTERHTGRWGLHRTLAARTRK